MNLKQQRLFFLVLAIVVIGVIALIVYVLVKPYGVTSKQKLGDIQLTENIKEKIFFPILIKDKGIIAYVGDEGLKIKKYVLSEKKIQDVSPGDVTSVQNVKFSPDGNKAVVASQDFNKSIYKILDFDKKTSFVLADAYDVSWLDNTNVAYSTIKDDKPSFGKVDVSSQKGQFLANLPFSNPKIEASPDGQNVIIYPEPEGYGANSLYLFNLKNNNLKKIDAKYNLVGALWSPDSQKIISVNTDSNGNTLFLVVIDINTNKTNEIPLITTLDKVTWRDNDNLLVAVPTQKDDVLYLSNLSKSKNTKLTTKFGDVYHSGYLKFENMMVNSQTLYFTADDYLYQLELK